MVTEDVIRKYEDLVSFQKNINQHEGKWVFRGEEYRNIEIDFLKTTLEKAFDRIGGYSSQYKIDAEKDIIREFQRKLHLYTNNIPTRADILQWLALMQHHGAPTRLLDWTYSFWVAVHFAIDRRKLGEKAAIWAVNATEIVNRSKAKLEGLRRTDEYKKVLRKVNKFHDLSYCDPDAIDDNIMLHVLFYKPTSMLLPSGPFRRNQRLTLQQGTFLIPGDATRSFQQNLYDTLESNNKNHIQLCVVEVTRTLREEIIKTLRQMNINNSVLFPDLDGFCDSLWTRVGLPLIDKLLTEDKNLTLYCEFEKEDI